MGLPDPVNFSGHANLSRSHANHCEIVSFSLTMGFWAFHETEEISLLDLYEVAF